MKRSEANTNNILSQFGFALYLVHGNKNCSPNTFGIHQVKFRFENDLDKIVFDVKLSRPGIFIGRQGKDFYQTQKELVKLLGADVEINLIEFSPCSNFQGLDNILDDCD